MKVSEAIAELKAKFQADIDSLKAQQGEIEASMGEISNLEKAIDEEKELAKKEAADKAYDEAVIDAGKAGDKLYTLEDLNRERAEAKADAEKQAAKDIEERDKELEKARSDNSVLMGRMEVNENEKNQIRQEVRAQARAEFDAMIEDETGDLDRLKAARERMGDDVGHTTNTVPNETTPPVSTKPAPEGTPMSGVVSGSGATPAEPVQSAPKTTDDDQAVKDANAQIKADQAKSADLEK